ncbi:MAG: hypothetical protein AAGU01_08885 [Clostridiaceae bacterium]
MKFGIRKPSLKKGISARTSIKRQVVHRAGLKMPRGYGVLRSPKKYVYNKIYNKTSFDIFKFIKNYLNNREYNELLIMFNLQYFS